MDYAVAVLALGLIMLGVERWHPGTNSTGLMDGMRAPCA